MLTGLGLSTRNQAGIEAESGPMTTRSRKLANLQQGLKSISGCLGPSRLCALALREPVGRGH